MEFHAISGNFGFFYAFFEATVEVPRIRIGGRQKIETLINEEALLFAKYLRNEQKNWNPRTACAQRKGIGNPILKQNLK